MTTLGKYRHLTQCSTDAGHFCVLAIDHRDNLLAELNKHAGKTLTDAEFIAFKREVIAALAGGASALLSDPAFGFGPGIADGYVTGRLGLLSPLEVTDYGLHPSRRQLTMIPNWSVTRIKRVGAQGVKLIVFYHPGTQAARTVCDQVARVVSDCADEDIPLFLEPIAYSPDENVALS